MKIYGNTEENEDSLLTVGNQRNQTVDEMKETQDTQDSSQSNHVIRFIKPLFQNQINQGNYCLKIGFPVPLDRFC